jgi:hypothetical protein
MQIFSAFTVVVVVANAILLIALTRFRQDRPDLRTRLFSWALHNRTHRRSASQHHSGLPA